MKKKNRKLRADGGVTVNVSFSESEIYLLDYADEQGKFSTYVKELIKQDMKKGNNEIPEWLGQLLKNNLQKDKPTDKPMKKKIDMGAVKGIIDKNF